MCGNVFGHGAIAVLSRLCDTLRVCLTMPRHTTKIILSIGDSDMTFEGLGEMFEGDCADMCARKFPPKLMGGREEGLVCEIKLKLVSRNG